VGLGVALFLLPRDRITKASWEKVRLGMTVKQVEDILCTPGLTYAEFFQEIDALEKNIGGLPFVADGTNFVERDPQDSSRPSQGMGGFFLLGGNELPQPSRDAQIAFGDERYWIGRLGCVEIRLNPQGRVKSKFFCGWRSAQPSVVDRLRDWLDL